MTTSHPRVILDKNREKTREITGFWPDLKKRASEKKRRVLFAESTDERVLSAVSFLSRQGIVRPVLVGDETSIRKMSCQYDFSIDSVEIVDPSQDDQQISYADQLFEKRKFKGLSPQDAQGHLKDSLYFSLMMLNNGRADGMVAGAVRTTSDTVRAAFSCLGLASKSKVIFGAMFMECPHAGGSCRRILFADSAVCPHPSPRVLAEIGVNAANLFERLTGEMSRTAFLSFSTLHSAEDESVSAVRKAVSSFRQKAPTLAVEGDIQGDAALNEGVARQKGLTNSMVAGKANVMIFPDLNSGNISYKLVQYLGGARAVGPFLVGLSKPISDVSRGCTDEDIVDAAALVSLL